MEKTWRSIFERQVSKTTMRGSSCHRLVEKLESILSPSRNAHNLCNRIQLTAEQPLTGMAQSGPTIQIRL